MPPDSWIAKQIVGPDRDIYMEKLKSELISNRAQSRQYSDRSEFLFQLQLFHNLWG